MPDKTIYTETSKIHEMDKDAADFGMLDTAILVEIAQGRVDANKIIREQLALRGLDRDGKWVGFDKAEEIHQLR